MDLWRMAGGQAALGPRPGRPAWLGWWAAASVGLHGLLLAEILLLDVHAPVVRESSLRVRLLTEARQGIAPSPPARLTAQRISPPTASRPRPEARRLAVASEPLRPPQGEAPASAAEQGPAVSPPSVPSTAPASPAPTAGPRGSEEGIVSAGPAGAGAARVAAEGLRPGGVTPRSDLAPEPPRIEARAQGVALVPESSGSGMGPGGSGASDQGAGVGGGDRTPITPGVRGGVGGAGGPAVASRNGSGPGGGAGLGDNLRSIRRRIEEAKTYPEAARRAGMEGTVEVRFQIGPGGAPVNLEIVTSSGYPELDHASLETIRRAGPYPTIHGRIRIPLAYRLDH